MKNKKPEIEIIGGLGELTSQEEKIVSDFIMKQKQSMKKGTKATKRSPATGKEKSTAS